MKKNEELLQRCFDGDLNDVEMKTLFYEMSIDETLRVQFRSFQTFRRVLRSIPSQNVPSTLDENIKSSISFTQLRLLPNKSAFRQVMNKKFTFSIPAFATVVLLLFVGSYFAATAIFVKKPTTEYVYVVEMPAYVVQSNYQIIKTN